MTKSLAVRTCLWFEKDGEAAAEFYTSLLPNSDVGDISRPASDGPALVVNFTLNGVPYQILNGGPHYKLTPAASISVTTKGQEQTDRLWDALTSNGGEESMCGWLVDRFGLSWQIVPEELLALLSADDREAAAKAQQAMMQMNKIIIADLQAAVEN